ncbi:carbohydrate ABC transporter permease [uncultured Microbacterium sp.]|uniref:carbohydrate ABC transporter permease n=1 Tax=uncultured Microbacterium sp. TaxID=191216 RepID=UPI0035CC06F4
MTNLTETETIVVGARRPRRGASARSPQSSIVATTGTTFILVIAAIYFLLPVWWLFVSSTKTAGDLFNSNGFWFSDWNLWGNIESVLTRDDGSFIVWLLNSILYATVGGAAATILGAACGYALAKFDFRGKGIVFASIIAGVLLPGALLTIPLFLLFSAVGVVNTYWSVLVPAFVSPFAVYLSRIYADASIPDEIIEAARVDGAGELRIFFTMGLRIMSPALITVFLFSFVATWNNFFLPLVMLKDQSLFPVTLGIFNWFNQTNQTPYADVITGSFLSVVPLIIAFIMLQRFWRAGLTAGAVKA